MLLAVDFPNVSLIYERSRNVYATRLIPSLPAVIFSRCLNYTLSHHLFLPPDHANYVFNLVLSKREEEELLLEYLGHWEKPLQRTA